jgi:hypothetical protein
MHGIFTLPNELQLHCFSFLLSCKDLAICSCVCKHFTTVANDNSLWKQWCAKVWHWNVEKIQDVEFKELFVNLFQATPETTIIPLWEGTLDWFCLKDTIIRLARDDTFQILDISDPKDVKVTTSFDLEPPEMSYVMSVMEWRQRVVVVYSQAVFIEKEIGLREFDCYHMETAYEVARLFNDTLCFLLAKDDSSAEEDEAETMWDYIEIMDLNQPTQPRKILQSSNDNQQMDPFNTFYISDEHMIKGYTSGTVSIEPISQQAWQRAFSRAHEAAFSQAHSTAVWKIQSVGQRLLTIAAFWQAHDTAVWKVQRFGKNLFTMDEHGIKVWENCFKPPIKTVNVYGHKAINSLGPRVFVSSSSGIEIWDYMTLAKIATIPSQAKSPIELHFIGSKIVRFVEAGLEVFDFAPKSTSQKPSES